MSDIDNIIIEYDNAIQSIGVEYVNEIDNITITLGADVQSVYSVNNLTGNVTLTYDTTLSNVSASVGVYSYTINHNLNYSTPIVAVYNNNNEMVMADIQVLNSNSVKIKSVINLIGYKVVIQR